MIFLASLLQVAPLTETPAKMCVTVTGTYAIYANNDLLHIRGSRHFVEMVSNALDKDLEQRGWQDTVAKGHFTLCGRRMATPLNWTKRDQIELMSVHDVRFVGR